MMARRIAFQLTFVASLLASCVPHRPATPGGEADARVDDGGTRRDGSVMADADDGREPDGATTVADATVVDVGSDAEVDAGRQDAGPPVEVDRDWPAWPIPPDAPPESNYTLGSGGQTAVDTVTGLEWQRALHGRECFDLPNYAPSWPCAIRVCDTSSIAGHDDWRLPTAIELIGILDAGRYRPSVNAMAFPNFQDALMSSTRYPYETQYDQYYYWVSFFDGGVGYQVIGRFGGSFTCVRDARNAPRLPPAVGRFSAGTETVVDNVTEVVWQREEAPTTLNHADAVAYCENLSLAGSDAWRLPSYKELLSIIDRRIYQPSMDPVLFPAPATPPDSLYFWSATRQPFEVNDTWFAAKVVSRDNGAGTDHALTTQDRVRCVR